MYKRNYQITDEDVIDDVNVDWDSPNTVKCYLIDGLLAGYSLSKQIIDDDLENNAMYYELFCGNTALEERGLFTYQIFDMIKRYELSKRRDASEKIIFNSDYPVLDLSEAKLEMKHEDLTEFCHTDYMFLSFLSAKEYLPKYYFEVNVDESKGCVINVHESHTHLSIDYIVSTGEYLFNTDYSKSLNLEEDKSKLKKLANEYAAYLLEFH